MTQNPPKTSEEKIEEEALTATNDVSKLRKLLWSNKSHAYQCGYVDGARFGRELGWKEVLSEIKSVTGLETEDLQYVLKQEAQRLGFLKKEDEV